MDSRRGSLEYRRVSMEHRRSFDSINRRRSAEMQRSQRRYDCYWGAAEGADTSLKCCDGQICHVHSQILACWSPVLRDLIALYPTHTLVESTHGLAYVFNIDEDSKLWTAVLDMIYPVEEKEMDWVSQVFSKHCKIMQ